MQKHRRRAVATALLAIALAALGLAGTVQAELTGNYTKFAQCPFSNLEVKKCIYSVTESGEVVLGNKKVPIEKQVVLQGGVGAQNVSAQNEEGFAKFFAASNGVTLSKAPQNVPGGLLGIVPDASSPPLVKALIKLFVENSLTGVNSTLELARPASEIKVSENNLAGELGVGVKLPVKIHLENPVLGQNCFVGSSAAPIKWELTMGETSPPAPNTPIKGSFGAVEFLEEALMLESKGAKLVDNAWAAPAATGCGGIFSFLVSPIINAQLGTTTAGHNTAILASTLNVTTGTAMRKNNEENS
jgi:hypothetical protein